MTLEEELELELKETRRQQQVLDREAGVGNLSVTFLRTADLSFHFPDDGQPCWYGYYTSPDRPRVLTKLTLYAVNNCYVLEARQLVNGRVTAVRRHVYCLRHLLPSHEQRRMKQVLKDLSDPTSARWNGWRLTD